MPNLVPMKYDTAYNDWVYSDNLPSHSLIRIEVAPENSDAHVRQVNEWCVEHSPKELFYTYDNDKSMFVYYFKYEHDAILFKLTFS